MPKTNTYNKKSQKEDMSEAPQVEELLKNLEFHKSIQRITNRIGTAETIREITVDIKEDIRKLFNIYILTIYAIDKAKKEIFTLKSDGVKTKEIRFPIDYSTFAGYVAKKKKMIHITDAYNAREIRRINDGLRFDDSHDEKTGILTGQIIASPIVYDGIVVGVMEIMNKKGGETIDDYSHIFLDEIESYLAKAFFMLLDFSQAGQIHSIKFEKLIQDGIVTADQMDRAVKQSFATKTDLATILMVQYNVSKSDIGAALEDHFSCPFRAYSDDLPVMPDLLNGLEKLSLVNMLWFPLNVVKGKIHVLIEDPSSHTRKREIEKILETDSVVYEVALAGDILKLIDRFYPKTDEDDDTWAGERSRRLFSVDSPEPDNMVLSQPAIDAPPDVTTKQKSVSIPPPLPKAAPPNDIDTTPGIEPAAFSAAEPEPKPLLQTLSSTEAKLQEEQTIPDTTPPLGDMRPNDDVNDTLGSPAKVATQADNQVLPLLTDIIFEACSRRASDIHFEPDPANKNVNLRIRIDGQCLKHQTLSHEEYEKITDQVKLLANLNVENHSIIQNGKLKLKRPSGDEIQMRVTFIPTNAVTEDTVIHISSKARKIPLELLGLSEASYAELVNILRQPRGMIFIVGPAGAGMNTTLHACLDNINTPEKKIWTAEESIEIRQNGLRQVLVDPRKGLDFPSVLRSFLNADPDVIMASQVHDPETAGICMEASLKRHLVLSTLWAESIIDAIEKCLDMGINPLVFADAMLSIVEQRLIKTLCPKCKEPYNPGHEEYEELAQMYGKDAFDKLNIPYSNHFNLFRPRGCDDCHQTGYSGRMCVSENLIFTAGIKRMIRRKESPESIYQAAVAGGMTTLLQDGISKVLQGHSDPRQIRLVCLK
ncbi:MAG: GspE/PulE family protein [Smithellaceae bacterium]